MNLTELVRLSNRLEELTLKDLGFETQRRFEHVMHESDVPDAGVDSSFRDNLATLNQNLQTQFDAFEHELARYKLEVQKLIREQGVKWLQTSSAIYEQQLETRLGQQPEAIDLHRNKPTQLDKETETIFRSRVAVHNNWLYPAMIIHPMAEPFMQDMLANDPLYLVDESHYLLEPTLAQWNTTYRNRLREYHIEENFDQPILDKLPDGQFVFCLVYNYLNYRPYELIKTYLSEIYQKLRPGGVLAMTFNDCDRYQAIQLVEQHVTCYTPGSLVKGWAEYIGFEKIFEYQDDSASTWIEFQKPGDLTSLRGGQALAKILPKPVA
jgi:hypothetical protein